MQFLGYSFIQDKDAYTYKPPIEKTNVTQMTLRKATYDYLYASSNASLTQCDTDIPDWTDNETIMRTHFANSPAVSYYDEDLNNIDKITIKRRIKNNTSNWETIYSRSISSSSDFGFSFKDYLVRPNCTYQYNIIPSAGNVEYQMNNIVEVNTDYYGVFVTDGITQYGSQYDIDSTYNRKKSSSIVVPLNSKYPISVENGNLNYKEGNVKTRFLLMENDNVNLDDGYNYREEITDFLTQSPVLVFKNYDGFIGIVSVGDEVSNDNGDYYRAPFTSFTWTQIGDANNMEELKKYGFIREG